MGAAGFDLTFAAMAAPFLGAALAPLAYRLAGAAAGWILALFPALVFVRFLALLPTVAEHRGIANAVSWIWQMDVSFAYLVDGLSVLFVLAIAGTGALAVVYADALLRDDPRRGRFQALLMLFVGASVALVLADDFLMLFIFWELSAVAAFLLTGSRRDRPGSRRAALDMFAVVGAGSLFLLAGFLLMIVTSGASTMTDAFPLGPAFRDHRLYGAVLGLILVGALTRAAQFPLQFWLPAVMHAPAPAAALFGPVTLAAAGVYLLMRLHPVLGTTVPWSVSLTLVGGATVVAGTARALRETGLMRMLASSTVASLGLMVMLIGTSLTLAIMGAVAVFLAHALFRAPLLMIAGTIERESGATEITRMGGLRRTMPLAWYATILAVWSMAGMPLALGSYAAVSAYDSLLGETMAVLALIGLSVDPGVSALLAMLAVAVLAHAGFVATGLAAVLRPFTGASVVTPRYASDGPAAQWFGPLLLGALGILTVLAGGWTVRNLVLPATVAVASAMPQDPAAPIGGLFGRFGLVVLAWALGLVLYVRLDGLRRRLSAIARGLASAPRYVAGQAGADLAALRARMRDRLAGVTWRQVLVALFAAFGGLALWAMTAFGDGPEWPLRPSLAYYQWFAFGFAVIGLFAVLVAASPVAAIIASAIPGVAASVIATFFGAPDVALALVLVTVLAVALLLLASGRAATAPARRRPVGRRIADGIVAGACGIALCGLLVSATSFPFDESLQAAFTEVATRAGQRNIVHVILADVRALDMLGVAVAMLIAVIVWSVRGRG